MFPLAPGEEGDGQQQLRVQKGVVVVEGVGQEPGQGGQLPRKVGKGKEDRKTTLPALVTLLEGDQASWKGGLGKGPCFIETV